MRAADTNVVVRLLVRDDPDQFVRADAFFRQDSVWISLTVILETEWVLRSAYGFARDRIAAAFAGLAGLPNVSIENVAALFEALRLFGAGIDFADALHVGVAGNGRSFSTFDADLVAQAARVGLARVQAL